MKHKKIFLLLLTTSFYCSYNAKASVTNHTLHSIDSSSQENSQVNHGDNRTIYSTITTDSATDDIRVKTVDSFYQEGLYWYSQVFDQYNSLPIQHNVTWQGGGSSGLSPTVNFTTQNTDLLRLQVTSNNVDISIGGVTTPASNFFDNDGSLIAIEGTIPRDADFLYPRYTVQAVAVDPTISSFSARDGTNTASAGQTLSILPGTSVNFSYDTDAMTNCSLTSDSGYDSRLK